MKTLLLLTTALFSITISASEIEVLKSCNTTLSMPGESKIEASIVINSEMGALSATFTQRDSSGNVGTSTESVTFFEDSVKAGLDGSLEDAGSFNRAETLIKQAIFLVEDPIMEGSFSAGLDLRKVRSAKIYTIGEASDFGQAVIIEAKDEAGKDMGSFFSGILIGACK